MDGFKFIILEEAKKRFHPVKAILFALLLFACTDTNVTEAHSLEELRNGLYDVDLIFEEQPFQMKDGIYFEYPLPDSPNRMEFRLTDHIAYDPFGKYPNAAFSIYTLNGGGSGTFFILAVVMRQNEALIFLDSTGLGDRVELQSLEIIDGNILLKMTDPRENGIDYCPLKITFAYDSITRELVILSKVEISATPTAKVQSK